MRNPTLPLTRPADPLADLLARAVQQTQPPALRHWLRALLASKEHASFPAASAEKEARA